MEYLIMRRSKLTKKKWVKTFYIILLEVSGKLFERMTAIMHETMHFRIKLKNASVNY